MKPAIFLDRDGVVIENRANYVRSWDDVSFIPAALEALCKASDFPYKLILITNQSAVGRGIIPLEKAEKINERVSKVVKDYGGRLDALYMCPHKPEDHCNCRKPHPGMLLQAAKDLNIDLSLSYMIGDALSDLKAGWTANVRESILVRTGRGETQSSLPEVKNLKPFPIVDTLADALDYILNNSGEIDAGN